ncbi:MAG: type I DNA topoisomerase [Rickettsiales bacterium]|jgi:DNA topoisomerase-1|nr:type I DNA topoisomerase [Rickettsiales bacterium]
MNLLIVESPAKAKTIEKYLGDGWRVIASIGHIRDLVASDGSVDTDNDFDMKWQIMPGKEKQLKLIMDAVKSADAVYLASDPDREGEAISWHLLEIMQQKKLLKNKPVYRVAFNEITRKAITDAIKNPREIDQNLVDAYLVRRVLDYLIGFKLSPVLWRKNMGRSAGRVQSVAVALVVAREMEIEAFNPVEYWSLDADCNGFNARLTNFADKKIEKLTLENSKSVDTIIKQIGDPIIPAAVVALDKKKTSRKPAAPFTTSTLQQEAARKLYFSARRTSSAAQKLYEAGLITYIRTDSTNLSTDAVSQIRDVIKSEYGDKFLPKAPNIYTTKSKNAQEAHEAIRPTDAKISSAGDGDGQKLYDLIWKRTMACQMTNAEFDSVSLDIKTDKAPAIFHTVGTTRTFDGFLKVYVEGTDDDTDENNESKLPLMNIGDKIEIIKLLPEQHFTMPPPRYSEASLIKKLEELGIGRPSTYSSIMGTIVEREYVKNEKHRFFPTPSGWLLTAFLQKYFTDIVDVNFTAKTEDTLDDVANGETKKLPAMNAFWSAFSPLVANAAAVPNPDVMNEINNTLHKHLFPDGDDSCPVCKNGKLELKVSKYGAFLACSNYPTCKYTKNLTTITDEKSENSDDKTASAITNGVLELGDGFTFRVGRFGPYVSDGKNNAPAKQYTADTITLAIARDLIENKGKKSQGEEIGINPTTNKPIVYFATGRYGAYISSNKVNVSVKEKPDLDTAVDLINNKKPTARWKKKK